MTEPLDGLTPAELSNGEGTGIVGNRHLIAVQTFDIARLTTHPVPLVPGAFIAVTGQGPKGDSNGSGKTSFEAATSLILGEAQWRLEANGAQHAAGLLFSPASAGLDPSGRYSRAEKGYIVAVLAEPERPAETVLTVWMRLAQTAPYIKVRWAEGLHVASGDSDLERHDQSDAIWASLPRSSELGAKTFTEKLYGDAPRCMAYVDTTLRPAAPSLLSQEMTKMPPAVIGDALIELTGRQGLLETEEEQRGLLAEKRDDLAERLREDTQARINEQADLDAVTSRNNARQFLQQGEHAWRLHYAKGYLDVLVEEQVATDRLATLNAEVAAAQQALNTAKDALDLLRQDNDLEDKEAQAEADYNAAAERLADARQDHTRTADELGRLGARRGVLLPIKDGWTGLTVEDAITAVEGAEETVGSKRVARITAEQHHANAQNALTAAEAGAGGPAGPALIAMHDAGLRAVSLLDVLTLSDGARSIWEPRLWPYQGAVVIDPADEPNALAALAAVPGSSYVLADGPLDQPADDLPDGVASSVPVTRFLQTVAARTEQRTQPDRAVDLHAQQVVLGGFPAHIAGRAARIAAATANVQQTEQDLNSARRAETGARLALDAAREALTAAEAVVELADIETATQRLQALLGHQQRLVATADLDATTKRGIFVRASANAQGHAEQVQIADQRVLLRTNELSAKKTAQQAAQTSLDRLNANYWRRGWGGTEDEARTLLAAEDVTSRRITQGAFRARAADALNDALREYESSVGGVLPPQLAQVRSRREALRDGEPGVSGMSVEFGAVARPLRDELDARSESDVELQARIERLQAARSDAIATAQQRSDEVEADLLGIREGISQRLDHSLRKISEAWDRLSVASGGFGAKLKISSVEPATPTSPWKWEVTPMWRRSSTGGYVSYTENANGAQVKLYAIQLVLAALLAADGAKGRVLILDELGNSLGDVNRKDILDALATVARAQQVTILGTCQDSVIGDAASACGQILWFSHAVESDAYNQPTRMWAFDDNRQRVEMTRDWITAGRTLV